MKLGIHYAYAMKTDDDSYVALDRITSYLDNKGRKPDYVGKYLGPRKPFRDPKHQYFTSFAQYPESLFPAYCQGLGFLLSPHLVRCIVVSMRNSRFLKHEDVFIGLLAERCHVSNILAVPENNFRPYRNGCTCDNPLSVRREVERVNRGKDLGVHDVLPEAEMAAKMIQHRINNSTDMLNHHKSATDERLVSTISEIDVGNNMEYYYSDKYGWCRIVILALATSTDGIKVKVKFYSDGSVEELVFLPYLQNFRNPY